MINASEVLEWWSVNDPEGKNDLHSGSSGEEWVKQVISVGAMVVMLLNSAI